MLSKLLGSAPAREDTHPRRRADDLADVVLPDHTGAEIRIGDLWADRPVVLVWLRHYGWVFCREHAVQLHRDRQKFEDAGVRLVLIGQGTPEDAAAFREQHGLDLHILTDRRRETYRKAGTKVATVGELFGPAVVARGIKRSVERRVFQGRTRGHPSQLGGVVIVTPDGAVAWTHLAQNASDNPPNEAVLEAAREAAATSPSES